MAKMHSRKKGRAGSKRPGATAQWVTYEPKEIEKLVLRFRSEGKTSSVIGSILRDQYGIPSVKQVTKKTIKQILKENEALPKIPEDLLNLLRRAVILRNHMEKNKADYISKHGLELLESKIRRLGKYYIRRKELPQNWKYDPEQAKLIVETTK